MVNGDREIGLQGGCVVLHHPAQVKPLANFGQDRYANLSFSVGDHEVHDFRGDLLCGADEVSFVFAILGVHDNDDPTVSDRINNRVERRKAV